jgi:murein L,D-transpeptidase YafK
VITRRALLLASPALFFGATACAPSKFRRYTGPSVTQVVVHKARRRMYLLHHATALTAYDIELGSNPVGHKIERGDGRTPEGLYIIDRRNPNSAFHLSIGISYPDAEDKARAEALGLDPGGDIFIHGTPRAKRGRDDWTAGCIAVTNREMEDVYAMVADGTPISIHP